MASLRFPTVRDVYDAFPTARDDVGEPISDTDSLALLQALAQNGAWDSAISFCAYLLPRRDAVSWGCQSLRHMQREFTEVEIEALNAAEKWVHEPEEGNRREALKIGTLTSSRMPAAWMALAAGWSGGSIMPPEYGMVPAEPHQTARAVRAGLLIAASKILTADVAKVMRACMAIGADLALGKRK